MVGDKPSSKAIESLVHWANFYVITEGINLQIIVKIVDFSVWWGRHLPAKLEHPGKAHTVTQFSVGQKSLTYSAVTTPAMQRPKKIRKVINNIYLFNDKDAIAVLLHLEELVHVHQEDVYLSLSVSVRYKYSQAQF